MTGRTGLTGLRFTGRNLGCPTHGTQCTHYEGRGNQ